MSNYPFDLGGYPAGVTDADFNDDPEGLDFEEDDEMRYCKNEWCDNELMPDDDENEPCLNCREEQAKTAAYWERQYRASKDALSKDEVLDAYSDPTDYQKRQRMEREL